MGELFVLAEEGRPVSLYLLSLTKKRQMNLPGKYLSTCLLCFELTLCIIGWSFDRFLGHIKLVVFHGPYVKDHPFVGSFGLHSHILITWFCVLSVVPQPSRC